MSGNESVPPGGRRADEDQWKKRLADEFAADPDSPASLHMQAQINAFVRPRLRAVEQLVAAYADQLTQPGPVTDTAVSAAIAHWERVCEGQATPELLQGFQEDAVELVEARRRSPPLITEILAGVTDRSDVGYEKGLHMHGLVGTWHRLWGAISAAEVFRESQLHQDLVGNLRTEFEVLLGRAMSSEEWVRLVVHAHRHATTVVIPSMTEGLKKE